MKHPGNALQSDPPRSAACEVPGRAAAHVDDLLVQIAHGSQEALGQLYDLLAPLLLELLRCRLPEGADARSALVDGFSRVWRQAPSYETGPHALDWVIELVAQRER
ncbi:MULTISPECIES: hypothetical protein [Streptomyces]|uniref:RNA polymerase sigma-70 region 2 domain-containing protein n=1 Tax=Streptomyces rhizosphaericola TaxID=2564098 RepID=A0ABY2P6G0_9ACTN|nr:MULTISPECIES: hypothetical protein [Streptomyces]ARI53065.1 hypothetical protein A6E92_13300 [Streptomyces sp. S8]MYT99815.1 hypothetical protein [Streptomyces sp. SID8350]NGO86796.1 hypothetical protein [Streptomyces sp. 196(2019)]TGY99852.1 hypothetical protein E5Z02_30500 [Streptomyces rhizosphaericola]SCK40750.1 RNA polymerase sigma-70 factor, ECF subfamily [Streptomyces sp. AmelKG-D3]